MKTLSIRDLINVGVFTAIYYVSLFIGAIIGIFGGPIFLPLGWLLSVLANSLTISLYMKRVKKFGALTILNTIIGLLLSFTGHSLYSVLTYIFSGLLADFVAGRGEYKNRQFNALAYGLLQVAMIGPFLPMYVNKELFFAEMAANRSEEYAANMQAIFSPLSVIVLVLGLMAVGYLASLFGQRSINRNFASGQQSDKENK